MKLTSLFMLSVLFISVVFLPHSFAQDDTRWGLPEGAKLRLGKGQINSYQFSPDNTQLAVMSSIGIWLYDVQTGKALRLLTGHTGVVLNSDWQTFAKRGEDDNTIELWDLHTGTLKATFEGHKKRVSSVAFHPDGKMLASSDYEGVIWLWDIATRKHRRILTSHDIVDEVMFSPDGRTIMSRRSSNFQLWDIATGEFKASLEDTAGTNNIAFNPDGTILFGAAWNELRLWDADTGKIKMKLGIASASSYPRPVFSPDGKTIASTRRGDSTVQLWDPHTGQLKNVLTRDPKYVKGIMVSNGVPKLVNFPTEFITSIAFNPDGRILAVSSNREIVFCAPDTGQQKTMLTGLTGKGAFRNLLFSPDGRTLAVRNKSGIYLWSIDATDIGNSEHRHTITSYSSEVNAIAFSSDGQRLASGHEDSIRLWRTKDGQCQVLAYQSRVQSVAFSPNGETLASLSLSTNTGSKAKILLWDAVSGKYQVALKGHGKIPDRRIPNQSGLAFSPNGEVLASGSGDGTIRLWNGKTTGRDSFFHRLRGTIFGHHKATLKGHTAHVLSVVLSPDGRTLASGSSDKTVRLWALRERKLKATLTGHVGGVSALAFSPDRQTLASGGRRGILLWDAVTATHKTTLTLLWHPDTMEHKATVTEDERLALPIIKPTVRFSENEVPPDPVFHVVSITSLAFSPDGNTLASATGRGTIVLLDMSTLKVKKSFSGHTNWVNSVAFSPDGRTLASGSKDGTILIWELEP